MKQIGVIVVALAILGVSGCEAVGTAAQSKTVQGGLLGSGVGAAAGAIIGNQSGHAGEGAAVGAGLGALGGGLIGNAMGEQDRAQGRSVVTPSQSVSSLTKFCPVGGEVFSENVKYCPNHGVELRLKE